MNPELDDQVIWTQLIETGVQLYVIHYRLASAYGSEFENNTMCVDMGDYMYDPSCEYRNTKYPLRGDDEASILTISSIYDIRSS